MKSHHKLSWRKILPEAEVAMIHTEADQEVNGDSSEFSSMFNLLGHRHNVHVSESDITEWLQTDETDHGHAYLSDDEIVTAVVEDFEESEDESDEDDQEETELIYHDKAVKMFDGCLKWLLQQDGACVSDSNVKVLQELHELAV